jgi:HlyD family secretion protein
MSIADFPARQRALEARLASARAGLDEIALELERAPVVAPYDAIIAKVSVTAGDQVRKDDVLLTLYAIDSLEVRARIPAPFQAELTASLQAAGPPAGDRNRRGSHPAALARTARRRGERERDRRILRCRGRGGAVASRADDLAASGPPPQDDAVPAPFGAVYGGDRVYKLVDGRMKGVPVRSWGAGSPRRARSACWCRRPISSPGIA